MKKNTRASRSLPLLLSALVWTACSLPEGEPGPDDEVLADEAPAAQAQSLATTPGARPASVPKDFVPTPNGYFHPSCIVELAEDEKAGADGSIVRADGSARKAPSCQHPRYDRAGRVIEDGGKSPGDVSPRQVNGWVSSTQLFTVPGTLAQVSATWNVPADPGILGEQTLYMFPALQGAASIVQPVLGWNMQDDPVHWRWTIASWNCCAQGTVFHSPLIAVAQGDELFGSVVGRNCASNGVCNDFDIVTRNNRTGQSTTLHTGSWGQGMNLLIGGALEVYGADHCAQYPGSSSVFFHHINAAYASGDGPDPFSWGRVVDYDVDPWCSNDVYAPDQTTTTLSWTPLARPHPARPPCGRISARQGIVPLESLLSCNSQFILQMQLDGNLVLYYLNANGSLGPAIWATNTQGRRSYDAVMQTDGNFVLYDISGNPLWASGTHGNPGAYLSLQDNGDLLVYAANGRVLWRR